LNWPDEEKAAEVDRERKRVAELRHCDLWQQQREDWRLAKDRFLTFIVSPNLKPLRMIEKEGIR
jgi:hypothetical protein